MNTALVLPMPRDMHLSRSSSNVPRLPSVVEVLQKLSVLPIFEKVHDPLPLLHKATSERPKVVRTSGILYLVALETCFSPQRRAPFRHLNLQKWFENGVL